MMAASTKASTRVAARSLRIIQPADVLAASLGPSSIVEIRKPRQQLARHMVRSSKGICPLRYYGRPIPAYILISLDRSLFYSGFYRIGAALTPMGARPRLSPRPLRPRRSGPPFLQGIVTLLFRLAVIASARCVPASAVLVAGRRVVYTCNERSRIGILVMIITDVQRNAKFASLTDEHLWGGTNCFCQCLETDTTDRLLQNQRIV